MAGSLRWAALFVATCILVGQSDAYDIVGSSGNSCSCSSGTPSLDCINVGLTFPSLLNVTELATKCPLLQSIYFYGNPALTSLPASIFSGLTNLNAFYLDFNAALTSLPETIFSGLSKLTVIYIKLNRALTSLPEAIFSGLTNATHIYLTNNSALTSLPDAIFSGLTSATHIDLSNTSLQSLPNRLFSNLTMLKTVDLSGVTSLTSIPASSFFGSGLTTLYCPLSSHLRCDTTSETFPCNGSESVAPATTAALKSCAPVTTTAGTSDLSNIWLDEQNNLHFKDASGNITLVELLREMQAQRTAIAQLQADVAALQRQ